MKSFITFLLLFAINLGSFSQNELDARIELESAENEMEKENYKQALIHLDKAQEDLGSWSGRISFMKIISLDNLCDYSKKTYRIPLENEVVLYKEYASKNPEKIDLDKYKDIKRIDGMLTTAKERGLWPDMPEYKTAREFDKKEEYTDAMLWYRKAVEKGNPYAMSRIGLFYKYGYGVEIDKDESMKWRKRAADEGDINEVVMLAITYCHEHGYIDYKEAMIKCREAVEKAESATALRMIGSMYENGWGVTQDYTEAMKSYKRGWMKENKYCLTDIGRFYQYGYGIDKDASEALKWYNIALENGVGEPEYYIGLLHETGGNGIKKNYAEAILWYTKSAENKEDYVNAKNSMNRIGLLFRKGGFGIEKNDEKAVEWYRKSAGKYCIPAMYNLGFMYEKGYGVPANKTEAIKWYKEAAGKNHEKAKEALKRLGK